MRRTNQLDVSWFAAGLLVVTSVGAPRADGHLASEARQSPPALRAGVDMVTIDVQVSATKGGTVRTLTAADFEITISGRKRNTASATFLHDDEGTVTRDSIQQGASEASPECTFGFHRREDRRTAHYRVGVDRIVADEKAVKNVRVSIRDKALAVQQYVWLARPAESTKER